MSGLPRVKVCGVTRPADAALAVELGAELVGVNFHPPSPRAVSPRRAAAIARAVRGRAALVGVFVRRPRAEVEEIAAAAGLDLLQFHGDEAPEELAPFAGRAVKVVRLAPGPAAAPAELAAAIAGYPAAWGFLFDVRHDTLFGGTGRSWSWSALAPLAGGDPRPRLVAGGVGPGNVRRALAESRADGVDVCSGVESAPGIKDPDLLERLFSELRTDVEDTDGESRRRA